MVDNLGVVRHVGRLLNGHHGSTPLELVTDGDLLVLIDRILHLRGHDTGVKGHADEGMVREGGVRELDRLGNNAVDEADDFGRRRADFPRSLQVWTDGSLVLEQVTGVSSSGAGFFTHQSEDCWGGRWWGHVDRVRLDGIVPSGGGFCSDPRPLQTVQRAEMWEGAILALQSAGAVHVGG